MSAKNYSPVQKKKFDKKSSLGTYGGAIPQAAQPHKNLLFRPSRLSALALVHIPLAKALGYGKLKRAQFEIIKQLSVPSNSRIFSGTSFSLWVIKLNNIVNSTAPHSGRSVCVSVGQAQP